MVLLCGTVRLSLAQTETPVLSFDTGSTVSKVRTARQGARAWIVASSYEGTLLGLTYEGTLLWTHTLSGFMNRDLWCEDITGDGSDEVLAANADGTVYCLDSAGKLQWTFKANDAPMNAVCVVHVQGTPYVVCGGYDKSIYYLSRAGKKIKEIPSSGYSVAKPWGNDPSKPPPAQGVHTANFLRRIRQSDGSDLLAVHGVMHSMSTAGTLYLFHPLAERPAQTINITEGKTFGDFRVCDVDQDGSEEILLGVSSMIQDAAMVRIDLDAARQTKFNIAPLGRQLDRFGYRVVQPEFVSNGSTGQYLILFGSRLLLVPLDMKTGNTEVLSCRYAFNDMWQDTSTGKIILASCQSGGSCIHVLDLQHPGWKAAYTNLTPPGKIRTIIEGTDAVRDLLPRFQSPAWERDPLPVYLMTESIPASIRDRVNHIKAHYRSPVFLNGFHMSGVENWDRSSLQNEKYRNRRDRRKRYTLTQDAVLDHILPKFEGSPGIAYWGGHGNDPYMFSRSTTQKVIQAARGKKTVLIYPELEDHGADFTTVMDDLIYPLAQYAQGKNAMLFIRTKHVFWQGNAYLPAWHRLLSGEFRDVFVPAMEETSDKSMELSLAARLGIWTSGAVDSWGARCARDNPSFDRLRQHSHQMLPNHFLRTMVYSLSSGAQYLNNFAVDQDYMSLLWELIARGILYVPKRSEIVSFSPVHLSMTRPDEHYLNDGSNVKWTTFYDRDFEEDNPFVFSRLNGTWPGAPVTTWDFSRYAAGVKERRLNFLPPYENGLVLITPPQHGAFADAHAPRGALTDHLHPMYRRIMKEYLTDGRHYYSADGDRRYAADTYYQVVEADIKKRATRLPLTVSGDVAWVAAQTSARHLRLTLVDSGYLNPKTRHATVTFHTVKPVKVVDLLDRRTVAITRPGTVAVDVPCGLFRFLDIELEEPL
jgi:hypothetical protein